MYYLSWNVFIYFATSCILFVRGEGSADHSHGIGNDSSAENDIEGSPDKFFLNKIFDKYGDGGIMTFEGFEHLLDSLGLGGGVFQAPHELSLHRINGSFVPIHDPAHRHKRHASLQHQEKSRRSSERQCLSPSDFLQVYGLESQPGVIVIKPTTFLDMCPALVYQIDQKSCYHTVELAAQPNDTYLAWLYASLSILIISATGLLGAAVMPLLHSRMFSQLLHFLVALAIGTLCGDAMLHLLPHSLMHSSSSDYFDKETEPIFKCCVSLLAILLFYSMESVMRIMTGQKGHGHSHSAKKNDSESDGVELGRMVKDSTVKHKPNLTPVALMVILGDGLHNLTDGLAIGAAFSSDPVTGFATALAVLCHELPHELGDFAVLLKSGMSLKRALFYNIVSSVLSFLGMAAGLWFAEAHASSSQWIYAATAGTFLYIALADLVPEINGNDDEKLVNFFLAFLGIVLGGIIMLGIALHEDSLKDLFE